MGLKDELEKEVRKTFRSTWEQRDGTVVPTEDSIKLGNDGVKLADVLVLYADLADSTQLVKTQTKNFAAEVYKTFLHCAGKILRNESGTIVAYDGDRIMAVFIEGNKNTNAVKAALEIKWAVDNVIQPQLRDMYSSKDFEVKHVVGIDRSQIFVANAGVRGAKDLVWVGNAANIAAKLSALPHQDASTYITKAVYDRLLDPAKISKGVSMWTSRTWVGYDSSTIYSSNWSWRFD
jgi:class 3 adenylate cyclase